MFESNVGAGHIVNPNIFHSRFGIGVKIDILQPTSVWQKCFFESLRIKKHFKNLKPFKDFRSRFIHFAPFKGPPVRIWSRNRHFIAKL